jgi:uncharacterized membrane protein YkoI
MKSRFSPCTLAFVVALGLTTSLAAQTAGPRESEMLAKTAVPLVQAVQIAEKQESGKTVGAEFDIEKDRPVWEVQVLGTHGLKEYKIDGASGAVMKIDDEHIRGRLVSFLTGTNLKDIEAAKTSVVQAVSTAEKKVNGKAVKVEVEHERGAIQYAVFVRVGDKTEKIKIDAATGQVK